MLSFLYDCIWDHWCTMSYLSVQNFNLLYQLQAVTIWNKSCKLHWHLLTRRVCDPYFIKDGTPNLFSMSVCLSHFWVLPKKLWLNVLTVSSSILQTIPLHWKDVIPHNLKTIEPINFKLGMLVVLHDWHLKIYLIMTLTQGQSRFHVNMQWETFSILNLRFINKSIFIIVKHLFISHNLFDLQTLNLLSRYNLIRRI